MTANDEDGPREVAKRLAVEWPPEYWATFKTASAGASSVLLITKDEIIYGYMCLPLAGAQASIDTGADTPTARGPMVNERADAPQIFLTIEGQGEPIVIGMRPDSETVARSTAASINALAGPSRLTGRSSPDQIRMLAALRDHGMITDNEFEAEIDDLLSAPEAP